MKDIASLFETVLINIPEALFVVDAQGNTLFTNDKASQTFGYTPAQFKSFSIVTCFPDWFTLPPTGTVLETKAVDFEGFSFLVELRLAPVQTPESPILIALVRNIHQRIEAMASQAAEQEKLHRQIDALNLRERDLKSELNKAAAILEAHLPLNDIPGVQTACRFSPCHTLGGDMVKLFPVSDEFVGFCILDVSGHGIPASLLAISLARSMSTDRVRGGILKNPEGELRSPGLVLARLNEQYQILHDGEQFVTLLYGILDLTLNQVRYVAAGHPHPLRITAEGVFPLEGPINPPVGVIRSVEFEETIIQLSAEDSLFFYTDGVTETRSATGEIYSESRLMECLAAHRSSEPERILEALYVELERYRGGREQTDDVTSLILRIHR